MLRRQTPTAERTVTLVRQQQQKKAIDTGGAIRERPFGFKGGLDRKLSDGYESGHVSGLAVRFA
jgi:hypothetical protein